MAFFFLSLFTFVMFFQPAFVFPALYPYQPFQFSLLLAFGTFLFSPVKSSVSLLSHKYARYFFLFVAMQVISASSIWLRGGLNTLKDQWLPIVIVFILIAKSCTSEYRSKWIILMIVSGITYLSYYSLSDYLSVSAQTTGYTYRVIGFGWYEQANDLCFILVGVIPLAFYLAETASNAFKKSAFLFVCAMFAVNVLLTGSRNGLLGLVIVIPACVFSSSKSGGFFKSKLLKNIFLTLLVVSIITVGIAAVTNRKDIGTGQLLGDQSSDDRLIQWMACARMVIQHPFWGVGPDQSRYEMRNYGGVRGLPPHNTLIQVFADTGIPGGIFFILCTIYPLWEARQFFKINSNNKNVHEFLLYKYLVISLLGLWVCSFFSNRVYFKIPYVIIALIIAVRSSILTLDINNRA